VIAGRDLLFPRDVLIIPADMPLPTWKMVQPIGGSSEPLATGGPTITTLDPRN
jgi:hypothetical protein